MSEDPREGTDNPGVIAPPPLIYAGTLAVGLLLNRLHPVPFLPRGPWRVLGLPLAFTGLLIGLQGYREMGRAGTNVDPYKPSTTIVEAGPYRYTRNPLYLGMTLIYTGITTRANALPAALLLPIVLAVVRYGVIDREERYLERKFGDEYRHYKARVRRWV